MRLFGILASIGLAVVLAVPAGARDATPPGTPGTPDASSVAVVSQ